VSNALRYGTRVELQAVRGRTSVEITIDDDGPGIPPDKYEDVLVMQTSALGMDQRKPMIVGALQTIFFPRAIAERSDTAFRKFEGLADPNGFLVGALAGPVAIKLNGLEFEADILAGHKTGIYLDQQVNYQLVAEFARGGQVLDCFSFLGGFGLHAARAAVRGVSAGRIVPRARFGHRRSNSSHRGASRTARR